MNDAAINLSPFEALQATNPYLPKKSWLTALQAKQLEAFLQRGFPTRREELWKYSDTSTLAKQKFQWSVKSKSAINKQQPIRSESKELLERDLAPWMAPHKDRDILFGARKQSLDSLPSAVAGITIVFINGYFTPELSDLSRITKDITLCTISEALKSQEANIKPYLNQAYDAKRHPFAALNTALMTDGIYLSIPNSVALLEPIHCLFINTENNSITCPRHIIHAGKNSQVTIIEEYISHAAENYFTNTITLLHADENAQIHHYKIQDENTQATHIATVFVAQKENAVVNSFNLATGAKFAREDVLVTQNARGAECHLNGYYSLKHNGQHLDNHLHVDHIAAQGTSTMLYKGTLDKKSRAVFNGKVYVHPNAQHINAQQGNHNLLLSPEAEVDTKPELEIYADDVKCAHGATVGQLDPESLFYLRARGIEKEHAMTMLTHAFADDVFNKINHPAVKHYIQLRAGQHAE